MHLSIWKKRKSEDPTISGDKLFMVTLSISTNPDHFYFCAIWHCHDEAT